MDLFGFPLDPSQWNPAQTYGFLQLIGQIIGILNIPSVLLRRSRRPVAQLTWILCLLTLPIVGVILWWFMGRTHLERKRRRRARALQTINQSLAQMSRELVLEARPAPQSDALTPYRQALLVDDNELFPTTTDNHVHLLVGGKQAYPAFEEAIRGARHHVHVQFYIWRADKIGRRLRDLLIEKAREGVEVRLVYDAFGASALWWGGFMQPLAAAGGKVAPFLPFRLERSLRVNFRNHRKIIIVDGEVGFAGGLNVGDEYNDWYDVSLRVEGPVVNQLQEVFAEDWYFATRENLGSQTYFAARPRPDESAPDGVCTDVLARVVASGPDSYRGTTHTMFFTAITSARERIWITTPYFIPDQAIMMALRTAAMRGVDVRLMLPGKTDVAVAREAGRGYFEELLETGVKIFEYQPQVLHAKTLVFDRKWAVVGSANVDNRSFHLQFEVNLAFESLQFNAVLAEQFERRLKDSAQIDPAVWAARGKLQRIGEAAARLLSPVL